MNIFLLIGIIIFVELFFRIFFFLKHKRIYKFKKRPRNKNDDYITSSNINSYQFKENAFLYPKINLNYPLRKNIYTSFTKQIKISEDSTLPNIEYLKKKHLNRITICLLGDSVMANNLGYLEKDINVAKNLSIELIAKNNQQPHFIKNLATPGWQIVDIFNSYIYQSCFYKFNYVFFMESYNDAIYSFVDKNGRRYKRPTFFEINKWINFSRIMPSIYGLTFLEYLRERFLGSDNYRDRTMIAQHRKIAFSDKLDKDFLNKYENYLLNLCNTCLFNNSIPVLITTPFCNWNKKSVHQDKVMFAIKELNNIVIKTYKKFKNDGCLIYHADKDFSNKIQYFVDCVHFNHEGIELFTKKLSSMVEI